MMSTSSHDIAVDRYASIGRYCWLEEFLRGKFPSSLPLSDYRFFIVCWAHNTTLHYNFKSPSRLHILIPQSLCRAGIAKQKSALDTLCNDVHMNRNVLEKSHVRTECALLGTFLLA